MYGFRFRREFRGSLQAVVLDWAGTTVDYGCRAPAAVFIEVFRRRGVEITIDQAREPMGSHKKAHIQAIAEIPAVGQRWQEVHGRPCGEDDVAAMFADFLPLQLETLDEYDDLIPGTVATIETLRNRALKIGSTTGYPREMTERLAAAAARKGYVPDAIVCAGDVPAGRPEPWMLLVAAQKLRVFPMAAIVKIGDTMLDVAAGLNAGVWTIGVAKTGNELGLSETEIAALDKEDYERRMVRAYQRLYQAGAHYVVDHIGDVLACLDDIQRRLARGEQP